MKRKTTAGAGTPDTTRPSHPTDAGGPGDMGRLYLEIRAALVRYTTRYFKRAQEAEDVVQEAFVKVIEAQRKRHIDSPKSYLFRTARNISLKRISASAEKLTDEISDMLTESELLISKTLEEQFEVRENFELYCRAVRALPVKCRRAYVLCRVYGFSQQEVADNMGIGLKAVEGHLARATRRCLDYIEAQQAGSGRAINNRGQRHG